MQQPPAPPSGTALELDRAFLALAHRGRRALLALLDGRGPSTTMQLARCFPGVPRQVVTRHLACLQRGGLVRRVVRPSGLAGPAALYASVPEARPALAAWLGGKRGAPRSNSRFTGSGDIPAAGSCAA